MDRLLFIAFSSAEMDQADALALQLQLPFDLILLYDPESLTSEAEVAYVPTGTGRTADAAAQTIVSIASSYSHLAASSSMAAKDLLPRIAALLDAPMVSDVTEFVGSNRYKRSMYAGSIVATVEVTAPQVVLTVRLPGEAKCLTEHLPIRRELDFSLPSRSRVLETRDSATSRRPLSQARIVVSGGRPLRDAETFERVIGGFAEAFGGSVGATRAAVDAGIAPNDCQVGQTGKVVAPDLYIAAGISGSTQHIAGIKDSKLIVAINRDPQAPIFAVSDLGIVGDLFEVLPQLQSALKHS